VGHGGRREATFSGFTAWRRRHRLRLNEESHAIYLKRRELGRELDAKGWLYPSGEMQYGGGLDLDRIIVLEEETARLGRILPEQPPKS
jgi:hypothetical protein